MEQKHSNQHIKRRERAHDIEFARRKIKAGILISRLNKAAAGTIELSKSQLEATKMLLDKAVPSLQAIEQTNINPMDDMPEEQLLGMAKALITAHPELIAQLNLQPKPIQVEPEGVVSEQQTQCSNGNAA